jgi:hypothetical protein
MTPCFQCKAEMRAEPKFCRLCGHPTHPSCMQSPLAGIPSKVDLKNVGIIMGAAIPCVALVVWGLNVVTILIVVPFAIVGFAFGAIANSLNRRRLP